MDNKAEKKRLREWAKVRRGMLPPEKRKQEDAAVCRRVLELPAYRNAKTVFCYAAMEGEIRTEEILLRAWEDGKRVAVPKCRRDGLMDACEITSLASLSVGRFGILEPKEGAPVVPPEEIGLAVVPCLACDRRGYRLGYGGGYYDRYLAKADCTAVVLCRESLLLEKIPAEPFDCRADWVITRSETADTRRANA